MSFFFILQKQKNKKMMLQKFGLGLGGVSLGTGMYVYKSVYNSHDSSEIHKEIGSIISNYDFNNSPQMLSYPITYLSSETPWKINMGDKNLIDSIEDLREKNKLSKKQINKIKINLDNYPHNKYVIFKKNEFDNNIEIDFTD